jgi:hypothetical protein
MLTKDYYSRLVVADDLFEKEKNYSYAGTRVTVAFIPKQKILVLKDGQKEANFLI